MRSVRLNEEKDYKLRYSNYNFECSALCFRSIISNNYLKSEFRIMCRYMLFKISYKKKFPNNFRNRCLLTGRARSTLPYFKLSRIEFRNLAKRNNLIGVIKSSW